MFNIMVVEDDKNTMRLMETVLIQNGYNAIPACDSEEALALMDKKQIDLIVLDVMLPGIDGFQLTKMMREGGCDRLRNTRSDGNGARNARRQARRIPRGNR